MNIGKNKGITLVSLVITIIVLIILAGISLNLTLGKNGLFTMAKRAKENIELAQIQEDTMLNELYSQVENNDISEKNTVIEGLEKNIQDLKNKLNTLENNIAEMNNKLPTFYDVNIHQNITSTIERSKTNLSVTIPANSYVCITFRVAYNQSKPEYIEVSSKAPNEAENIIGGGVVTYGQASCTISGYINNDTTYTAYIKWDKDETINGGSINGFYVTLPK